MKRLYRSSSNKVIAGVCGGLGEYFNVDPIWFRVLFAIGLIPGGIPGLLPYLVLWLLMPKPGPLAPPPSS